MLCSFLGKSSKNLSEGSKGTSVLTSRKSSSTPSLPDATDNHAKGSVASTEQAASADNLAAKVRLLNLEHKWNLITNIVLYFNYSKLLKLLQRVFCLWLVLKLL